MSLPIEFDPDARAEFLDSALWYDNQRTGLGLDFMEEVCLVLKLISESPKLFGHVESGIRQATVKRFPFSVIYREEPSRILVLAVFHSARDPEAWKDRN